MDFDKLSLDMHEKLKGKIEVTSKVPVATREDLSTAYTPGVAAPCREIAKDKKLAYKYTIKANTIAVVSDGSAVLGLGNIGPEAALPVMEGKAVLFKEFAGVDAFPIVLDTQDTEEIIKTVKIIAPGFGGINLEDISAPRCFEIENRLKEELDIPVMHDDQHGTAVVVLAALINAVKVVEKELSDCRIVMIGAGAAGVAIAKLLTTRGIKDIVTIDSKGIVSKNRDNLNESKKELAALTKESYASKEEAFSGADVFIGVSQPGTVSKELIEMMEQPIIFALANPTPEIMPEDAMNAGAKIVATGRSDFPNQINNVLAFPGIFRGALDSHAKDITEEMKVAAAEAIASMVENPSADMIIPSALDKEVAKAVAKAVESATNINA